MQRGVYAYARIVRNVVKVSAVTRAVHDTIIPALTNVLELDTAVLGCCVVSVQAARTTSLECRSQQTYKAMSYDLSQLITHLSHISCDLPAHK